MSLKSFIENNCANYLRDIHNGCFLINRPSSGERCVALQGKPCAYFEGCLAPLAERQASARAALNEYEVKIRHIGKRREIRRCECGEPLDKAQRYCRPCKIKHRRESYRRHKVTLRQNGKCPQLIGENENLDQLLIPPNSPLENADLLRLPGQQNSINCGQPLPVEEPTNV